MHSPHAATPIPASQSISVAVCAPLAEEASRWITQISRSPGSFHQVENEMHQFFQNLSVLCMKAVLETPQVRHALESAEKNILQEMPGKWKFAGKRRAPIRLSNGDTTSILCNYYVPRRKDARRCKCRKPKGERVGVYPALLAIGAASGASPRLQDEVARCAILMPSLEMAASELTRHGIAIDVKTVSRILFDLADGALRERNANLLRFRNGALPEGDALEGKRVVASVDGGKARERVPKRGPKTSKGRTRFHTPWREPRLLIIYTVDEKGRKDRVFETVMDATLQGADAIMELLAMHLHRLGAGKAQCVEFVGDGADWIWDRIENVFSKAGIPRRKSVFLLDAYHAVQHIGDALKLCVAMDDTQRKKHFTHLRRLLLNGKASEVVADLKRRENGRNARAIGSHRAYLEKHLEHMRYSSIRRRRLPCGSGAVESAIRRVINLRIKSPGTFWKEEHLEKATCLRAQLLSGRWDEMIEASRIAARQRTTTGWKLEPSPMRTQQRDLPSMTRKPELAKHAA